MQLPLWLLKPIAKLLYRHTGSRIRLAQNLKSGIKKRVQCYGYQADLDSTFLIDGIYLLLGQYDEVYDNLCRAWLKPNDTVLDVGCNVGLTLFMAANATAGQTKLYGWEPDRNQFERCRHNLQLNPSLNSSATVQNLAVSDRDGELVFRPVDRGNLLVDSSGSLRMPCRSLDSLSREHNFAHVALLKCDTDGHETAFFAGAHQTIEGNRPVIFFESMYLQPCSPGAEPWAFLSRLGYLFVDARYPHAPLNPQANPPLDTLACPREKWGDLHPELSRLGAQSSRRRSFLRRLVDSCRYGD